MNDNLEHPTFLTLIEHIWKYSLAIIKDILTLFTLEVKLAGKSLATIFILVVLAALLLITSWFSLLGALVSWLLTFNLSLMMALFLVSAINLVFAFGIGVYIIKISRFLQFKNTRKQIGMVRNK